MASQTHRYRSLVLGLLVVAYTLNFVDRTIVSILGPAIKQDLKISDTQLGVLGGISFALLYTFLGVPIARISERVSRVNVIALSIAIWSGFTALCGAATGFVSLALFRIGVGFGEAGLTPPGHSLIGDYFPARSRATALAFYALGVPFGTIIGALAGGWIVQHFSWRVAFVVVGLPGLIVALLFKLIVREPARGATEDDPIAVPPIARKMSLGSELREIGAVARLMIGRPAVRHTIIGNLLVSFAFAGGGTFMPPFLIRVFGYGYATLGLLVALISGVGFGIGALLGGVLADRLSQRRPEWIALVPGIGTALGLVVTETAVRQTAGGVAVALLALGGLFGSAHLSTSYALLYRNVPATARATAAAIYLFVANLFATGLGPVFTGWVIDQFASASYPGAVAFAAACPGGIAPAGAAPEVAARCAGVLAQATRNGLAVTYAMFLWAALHFMLSAIAIRKARLRPAI